MVTAKKNTIKLEDTLVRQSKRNRMSSQYYGSKVIVGESEEDKSVNDQDSDYR
jgi:hypothetical protein